MAQISKLAQVINGFAENQDLSTEELALGSVTFGGTSGTNLTKAQLDTLISNSHASGSDNQNVVAGAGTTGGGTGATTTINVGAGTGMAVNADDIAIDFGTTGSKAISATSLASTANGLGASLIGLEDSDDQFTATDLEGAATESLDAAQAAQATADAAIPSSEKGAANGVATLDGSSKLPAAQLPTSAMEYKGAHNVATNTPTLVDATGTNGDLYRISVGGTRDYGSGNQTFAAGDSIIYNGSIWEKIPGEDIIQSVAGKTGTVTLDTDDVTEATNLYYTDTRAKTAAVDDTAYAGSWDAVTDQAPSKNAVYDKFESLTTADSTHSQNATGDWTVADDATDGAHLDELASRMVAVEADNASDSILKTMVAGESFTINVTVGVRLAVSGETAGRLYKVDADAGKSTSHCIGIVKPAAGVSIGGDIDVTLLGELSSSVDFTAAQDEGLPVFITAAAGVPTVTPPALGSGPFAIIGMVQTVGAGTSKIMVQSPRFGGSA